METNWKKGDIAICVEVGNLGYMSGNPPPLRLNAEYLVSQVHVYECGSVYLDVGMCLPNEEGTHCLCGAVTSPKTGIWWCNASRFVKKQTEKSKAELEEELQTALKHENYELASKLTKKLEENGVV